jgi:hypothetical protein
VTRSRFTAEEQPKSSDHSLIENKVQKVGVFFVGGKRAHKNHVLTTNYHVITIKKPRFAHCFSQKPLQKHHSTTN